MKEARDATVSVRMKSAATLVGFCLLGCGRTPYAPGDRPRLRDAVFAPGVPEHLGPVVHLCGEIADRCARLRLSIRARTTIATGELGDDPCTEPHAGGVSLSSFEGDVHAEPDRVYVLGSARFDDGTAIEIDTDAPRGECP